MDDKQRWNGQRGTVALEYVVRNQGTVATTTPNWQDNVYLSLVNQISSDDILLGSLTNQSALNPGESYRSQTQPFIVPKRFRGEAILIVNADASEKVNEYPQENNNILTVPVNVVGLPPADLVTSNVVAPNQAFEGSTISVRYTVTNKGIGKTDRDEWTDTLWLTRDKNRPTPVNYQEKAEDILLTQITHKGSLKVGESYEQGINVTLPKQVTGEWYITPWSDAYQIVLEDTLDININPDDPNEIDNNNYKARPITVFLTPPPDLVVTNITPTAQGKGGEPFKVTWTEARSPTRLSSAVKRLQGARPTAKLK